MSGTAGRLRLEQEAVTALCNAQPAALRSDSDAQIVRDVLTTYNNDSLYRLIKAAKTGLGDMLMGTLSHRNATDEALVIDWMALQSFPDRNMSNLLPFLNSMSLYEHLAPLRDGKYELRETQLIAVFLVTDHLYETDHVKKEFDLKGESQVYLKDRELRNLLTSHPDPAVVANIIIERGVTNVERLAVLLEAMGTTSPAIVSGVL